MAWPGPVVHLAERFSPACLPCPSVLRPPQPLPARSENTKKKSVRHANIEAAKAVADAVRTSLGPRGMDKMVTSPNGEVLITNDGATILQKMTVTQPAAKMLVELSKSQDVVAGDGTTSVVVICGALLKKCSELLEKGVHPTVISDAFQKAAHKGVEVRPACALALFSSSAQFEPHAWQAHPLPSSAQILESISVDVDLNDKEALIKAATT